MRSKNKKQKMVMKQKKDIMDSKSKRRERNKKIFKDTQKLYSSLPSLKGSIMDSMAGQKLFIEGKSYDFSKAHHTGQEAEIIVSGKRTLEAAMPYARNGKKVCVLNFASARIPGGGVTWGTSAQEESICRCSTLYANLSDPMLMHQFYEPHRKAGDPLNSDDCIYTPGVTVFKTDAPVPKLMQEDDWYKVNIITCVAPDLRKRPNPNVDVRLQKRALALNGEQLAKLHESRIRRMFDIAAHEGNEVLILGAFGCGAFYNPPGIVAGVFREVQEEYKTAFETIEYAIFYKDKETENFKVFQREILR